MDDKSLAAMTLDELKAARTRLANDLEDYEEMAMFHSINSPAHATVTEREAQKTKLQRMRDEIAEIDRLLG
ncbi:MAG: hypothetical protein HY876_02810 [Coriobacteriales bacterium]|nr:hypothetical protein [Coriobacteriales bacterium]